MLPNRISGRSSSTASGIFILMLFAILAFEMSIMGLFASLGLDILSASILDATILTLIFAALFWFILFRTKIIKDNGSKFSPAKLFAFALAFIFSVEFVMMMTMPVLLPGAPLQLVKLVDAGFTTLITAPMLWWLVCSRRMQNRLFLYEDFLGAPIRLFFLLMMSIFLTDLLTELIIPYAFPNISRHIFIILDSVLSTLVISPLFWWFLIRPLMKVSLSQKALSMAIYAQAVDAIITIDSSGKIVTFNPAAEKIFGYTADDITGRSGDTLFCESEQHLNDMIRRAAENNSSEINVVSCEAMGRRQDGSELVMDVSISRILLADRQEFLLIMRDISNRKQMEKTVRESEERLSLAVNASNDGIWDWNIKTGDVYYCPRYKALLGYRDNELQPDFSSFSRILHPDDYDHIMKAIDGHLGRDIPYDVQYRLRTGTGTFRWFRARGQVVRNEEGAAVRMTGSISDINTQQEALNSLRESEIRFRQIFEQSEDAIIFFKTGTCSIIDMNNTAEILYGFNKTELHEGGLGLLASGPDLEKMTSAITNIRKDRVAQLENIVNRRKDGSELFISLRGKIMTLQGIDIVYCTFRDVSDRLRVEKKSRDLQAKLIQANKMTSLGLLVSGVAHEINNPNNFIMASSELLEKAWRDALNILHEYAEENGEFYMGGIPFSQLESQAPRLFAGITDGTRRINAIVNNLKSFARNSGTVEKYDIINVNNVAISTVSILHYEISKFTKNFHLELSDNLPPVKGSSQQLGQVMLNLVMNACQALTDKKSGIWLTTGYDSATGAVTVTVRDEGCGMSRENSSMIMEPFFTTKIDSGGTGLGLSICQSIVKDHSWSLEFTSELHKGTTFVLKIPAGNSEAQEQSQ